MPLQFQKLQAHLPAGIYAQLPSVLPLGVDGPKRLAHLLGNCRHETGNWSTFIENLNYSEQGLLKTFPKYFNAQQAKDYARQPERIANRVYANRMGNRDEASGDGWYRRGRGALQTTGTTNQQRFFESIGLSRDSDPALISSTYALASGAFFFKDNSLWGICDQGVDNNTCKTICKRINGGLLGLDERTHYTQEFYSWLTS